MEEWRQWLYPLGFLSSIAFGGRAFIQWIASELKQQSTVNKSYWRLSFTGNMLLMVHAFIQVQFHVCLIQACNGVISWRNLNLMRDKQHRVTLQTVLIILAVSLGVVATGFCLIDNDTWFRIPSTFLGAPGTQQISPLWHALGFIALALFASRFWIQWWGAEKHQVSYLGPAFWWTSLAGDLLCILYFSRIADPVNLVGPALGLIPYIRNLMLIRKHSKTAAADE